MPFFPGGLRSLTKNYRAVIVCFADVPDRKVLDERIRTGRLDADFWYYSQTLDNKTYNRMASFYRSMDFDRSIVLYTGFPRQQSLVGNIMMWVATIGTVFSVFGFGWQSIALVVTGLRYGFGKTSSILDEEEIFATNRAGLPESFDEDKHNFDAS